MDATDICERLRREVAWEPDLGELMAEAANEIERLRLTDKEREAIAVARRCLLPCHDDFDATLGRLLERMG